MDKNVSDFGRNLAVTYGLYRPSASELYCVRTTIKIHTDAFVRRLGTNSFDKTIFKYVYFLFVL